MNNRYTPKRLSLQRFQEGIFSYLKNNVFPKNETDHGKPKIKNPFAGGYSTTSGHGIFNQEIEFVLLW